VSTANSKIEMIKSSLARYKAAEKPGEAKGFRSGFLGKAGRKVVRDGRTKSSLKQVREDCLNTSFPPGTQNRECAKELGQRRWEMRKVDYRMKGTNRPVGGGVCYNCLRTVDC